MRRAFYAVLLVTTLGLFVPAVRAQEEEPEPDSQEQAKPYVPPPAWKSVEIGNFYLKRKKYRGALSRFQEAVKTDPTYAPGYLGLGKVYEKIGLKQKALEAFRKYLDTLPSAKEAEEATYVHEAISRLERQRKAPRASPRGPSPRAEASHPH